MPDLSFFNCNFFASEVKRCIAEAMEPVETVLIDAEAMNDIDITGADRLIKLNTELNRKNIVMYITHVRDPLRDKMRRMGGPSMRLDQITSTRPQGTASMLLSHQGNRCLRQGMAGRNDLVKSA